MAAALQKPCNLQDVKSQIKCSRSREPSSALSCTQFCHSKPMHIRAKVLEKQGSLPPTERDAKWKMKRRCIQEKKIISGLELNIPNLPKMMECPKPMPNISTQPTYGKRRQRK